MKALFIYYSNTGNGDMVAERLKEQGAEIRKVIPKKPLPKSFFWSVMNGGFLAGIGHKAALRDFDPSVDGYDRIVIGSPIWNARISCPINSVVDQVDLGALPLTFVLWAGSGEGPGAVKRIKKNYPTAEIVLLKEPKKYPEELEKLNLLLI